MKPLASAVTSFDKGKPRLLWHGVYIPAIPIILVPILEPLLPIILQDDAIDLLFEALPVLVEANLRVLVHIAIIDSHDDVDFCIHRGSIKLSIIWRQSQTILACSQKFEDRSKHGIIK